jgi:hypothetical protein
LPEWQFNITKNHAIIRHGTGNIRENEGQPGEGGANGEV